MKVVAKPVEMMAWFQDDGAIHPIRFRFKNEDGVQKIIKIDRICSKHLERIVGNLMMVFKCQSEIKGIVKPYELKYELETCRWILFKI